MVGQSMCSSGSGPKWGEERLPPPTTAAVGVHGPPSDKPTFLPSFLFSIFYSETSVDTSCCGTCEAAAVLSGANLEAAATAAAEGASTLPTSHSRWSRDSPNSNKYMVGRRGAYMAARSGRPQELAELSVHHPWPHSLPILHPQMQLSCRDYRWSWKRPSAVVEALFCPQPVGIHDPGGGGCRSGTAGRSGESDNAARGLRLPGIVNMI